VKKKLEKKPEIYKSLRLDFSLFCGRLTPGLGYLEALVEDNVDFIGCGIDQVFVTQWHQGQGRHRA
jgi:hypothetical protein